ncbi:MAG: hypothetical protein QOJ64_2063 [Acidobacteriota bacterium]|nr:hypothetical protein [Acidobacteriota bacterium]
MLRGDLLDNAINKMGTMAVLPLVKPVGWLRNGAFDGVFIVGVMALALLSGWISVANPTLFPFIFVLDVWLLGYHHVIATYTRLTFDLESFRKHKFLLTWLPVLVILVTGLAALLFGRWILATTYLYWQWFHYTRQSYGVARIYARKNRIIDDRGRLLEQLTLYSVPLLGILYRSWQAPTQFLGMNLKVVPVPLWLVIAVGLGSAVVVGWWIIDQVRAYLKGEMKIAYTLFVTSHLVVFVSGYLLIDNINFGWLSLNVWHNAQYLMLVWMFNNRRFKEGVDSRHRFLSTISQTENVVIYFAVCVCLSTLIFFSTSKMLSLFGALPLAIVFYQGLNFHHYIVDGIIWKLRQKPIRNAMGVAE